MPTTTAVDAVDALQAFTIDLFRVLATQPGNVVCSPYSVAVALAMARHGARGQTAAELDAVLHSPGLRAFSTGLSELSRLVESRAGAQERYEGSEATVSLDVANSLWGQRDTRWEAIFLDELARHFASELHLVDYRADAEAARADINRWTAEQTHERIPEIIPAGLLNRRTRLVLVNAIYLKAPWEEPFEARSTERGTFARSDQTLVDVDMMHGQLRQAGFGAGPGWRAARLSYAGGKLAMTVVVPDADVDELTRTLDQAALTSMLTAPERVPLLDLRLPRWAFRLQAELGSALAALGMPTAFGEAADFRGMTTDVPLRVKAVVHEAYVAVDEEGTEAAASTAVVIIRASAPRPVVLTADRPFLFVIHDVETATPLFIGRVSDPTVGS